MHGLSKRSLLTRLRAKIHEAESSPDAWPEALASLTDALGVGGVASIVFSKRTRSADWVCFSGLSAAFEARYMHHYASLDPFAPLLNVIPGWTKLSECLPKVALANSEWYNDFVLSCGVRDIIGTCLIDTPSHCAIFGLHQQIGRSFDDEMMPFLEQVTAPLHAATLRQVERRFGATRDGDSATGLE